MTAQEQHENECFKIVTEELERSGLSVEAVRMFSLDEEGYGYAILFRKFDAVRFPEVEDAIRVRVPYDAVFFPTTVKARYEMYPAMKEKKYGEA